MVVVVKMNVLKNFVVVAFLLIVSAGTFLKAASKPTGLMTDLLKHTDVVYVNGYPSSMPLAQVDQAIEQVQYATVKSTHPVFGWIVSGNTNNTIQTSYRIIVDDARENALANKGAIWDSDYVKSSQSTSVLFGGEGLKPSTTYYWRVKTITNTEGESEWSDIKSFRTDKKLEAYKSSQEILVKTKDKPVIITKPEANIYFFDFGKASFGQLLVTLTSVNGGDTVTVNLGEKSVSNRVDAYPGATIRYQSIPLALRKGTHTYRIKINKDGRNTGYAAIKMPSYIGEVLPFRYAEIVGYQSDEDAPVVFRESVHYPFDETAAFRSDNDTLNQIWELSRYSIKATSFTGIYVDGDRERIPYEADVLINQLAHYGVDREYSMARFSHEYLLEYPTWPTEWILQAVLIAWYDYWYTGDSRSLELNYEILKNRTLSALKGSNGLISTRTGLQSADFLSSINFKGKMLNDIVDWPNSNWNKDDDSGYQGEADGFVFTRYNAVVNAYHYESLVMMAEIAGLLGKSEDAKYFSTERERVKKVFNQVFLDRKRGIYVDGDSTNHASLHSNMFAFDFGLVADKYKTSVLDFISSRGMACSVYGSQFLLDALYDGERADHALSLLTATDDRGWYNMIRAGSTMTLEAWDEKFKPNLDWNHAWGAAPANIIPRRLIGVEPLLPAFEKVKIKPQIASLTFVESKVPTIRGTVSVSIQQSEQNYSLKVDLPANMTGDVYLPLFSKNQKITNNGSLINYKRLKDTNYVNVGSIGSGSYTFVIEK